MPKKQNTVSQKRDDNEVIINRSRQKNKFIKKYISKNDKLQLFCICKKHKTLYGHKKEKYKMIYF